MGQGIMGGNHPYYAGRVGGWGNRYANQATREADVVITLGNRFDEDETGAWDLGDTYSFPESKLIHVHIDPREIGKIYPTEVGIHGDPKCVLQDIIAIIKESGKHFERGTKEKIAFAKEEYFREMSEYRDSDSIPINPHRFVKELEEVFPEDGIQVGAAICARNYYCHDHAKSAYYGYGMGLIGTTLAQALGFAVGCPDKKIVSVEGDGGFLIHSSLLATAAEYSLPVVWIVVNNSSYGTVWGLQRQYFENRSVLTEFKYDNGEVYVPDYAKMAEAYRVKGIRVERPEEIKPALQEAIAYNGPCLIDIVVDRTFSSTPPTVSRCGWDKYYPYW
jgi:acetolactate synthase-1/2/3 large subunit